MTSPRKKAIYFEKFKRIVDSEFNLFIYLPVSKAGFDYEHTQNLSIINLRRFTLPSAFKVIKKQKVQGSQISMAYSSAKTFINLKNIGHLNAYTIKYQAKWYAYGILESLKPYQKPFSLCSITRKFLFNKTARFKVKSKNYLSLGFHSSSKVLIKRQMENEIKPRKFVNEIASDVSSEEESAEPKNPKRIRTDEGVEEHKEVAPAPVTPPHENLPAADFARSYHSPSDTVLGGGYYPPGGQRLYRNMLERQGGMDSAIAEGIAAVRIGPAQDPAAQAAAQDENLAAPAAAQHVLPLVEAPVEAHVDLPVEGAGEVLVEVLEQFIKP